MSPARLLRFAAPLLAVGAMLGALGGCATAPAPVVEVPSEAELPPPHREPSSPAPPLETRTYALPDEEPAFTADAAPSAAPATPAEPQPINGPAVVALLDQAELQAQSGEADQAAATLERALRIEPHNPWLWHRLSVLRLQQGRYQDAIDLASRSNSLAAGEARLQSGNAEVIARSRQALGN